MHGCCESRECNETLCGCQPRRALLLVSVPVAGVVLYDVRYLDDAKGKGWQGDASAFFMLS